MGGDRDLGDGKPAAILPRDDRQSWDRGASDLELLPGVSVTLMEEDDGSYHYRDMSQLAQ